MADWMRSTVESTLGPAKATRQTRTETRTPTGGRTYTFTAGAWSYCNIAPMNARELEHASRIEARGSVSCRVSADVDFDASDRIVVSDSGADELDGLWEVTAVVTGYPVVDRLLYLDRVQA